MKSYYLTEKETALMLEALCIARRNADTTGTSSEQFKALFEHIVAQHDAQARMFCEA